MKTQLTVVTLMMTTTLALTACAKKGPSAGPASSPGTSAAGSAPEADGSAKGLHLDLMKFSTQDPGLPGEDKFKGGIDAYQPAYVDQEIILNSTVNLATGDRPALVWPQGEGKEEITSAVFAARSERSDNRVGGDLSYEPASWDRDGKRWFIPFDRIQRIQDFGPGDLQNVFIRLARAGGEVQDFAIHFHAAGPLVALQIIRDEQIAPAPTQGMFQTAGVINLRRLTIRNPMSRKVNLWVKLDLASPGPLVIGRVQFHAGATDLLLDINSQSRVSGVQVTQGDGKTRSITLDGWTPIRFEAGEQLALDWQAASKGCSGDLNGGSLTSFLISGRWTVDSWLTDESVTAFAPSSSFPVTLALAAGRAVYSVLSSTGNWQDSPNNSAVCR